MKDGKKLLVEVLLIISLILNTVFLSLIGRGVVDNADNQETTQQPTDSTFVVDSLSNDKEIIITDSL